MAAFGLVARPAGRVRRRRHLPHHATRSRSRTAARTWRQAVRDRPRGARRTASLREAGCRAHDVVIAVGRPSSPTMTHAWLGVPVWQPRPRALCRPVDGRADGEGRGRVGLPIHPNANVLVFPLVRSHVGGDAVAAAVACDLDGLLGAEGGPSRLLIDLGTNTELLLAHDGRLVRHVGGRRPARSRACRSGTGCARAPGRDRRRLDRYGRAASRRTRSAACPPTGVCGSGSDRRRGRAARGGRRRAVRPPATSRGGLPLPARWPPGCRRRRRAAGVRARGRPSVDEGGPGPW
ncbi:MAG: hypothetical protein MZV64_30865 [Ignavibacteriales bacterium]|nr:hypothetical protein [Ignavibacteriales bacterium]